MMIIVQCHNNNSNYVTRYEKRDQPLGIKFHFLIIAKMCGRLLFFTFLFFSLLENVQSSLRTKDTLGTGLSFNVFGGYL